MAVDGRVNQLLFFGIRASELVTGGMAMYNSPHFRVSTFTLACVLLISGGGLNLLHANNDPCFRKTKCPKTAKSRPGNTRPTRAGIPTSGRSAGTQVAVGPKRPVNKKPPQTRPNTTSAGSNVLTVAPNPTFDSPADGLSIPESSFRPNGSRSFLSAGDISPATNFAAGNSVEATIRRGYELFNAGKHKEATKQFREVLKNSPNNVEAHNGLGDVHMIKGRHSEAIKAYRKALELDPKNIALADKLQQAVVIEKEQDKVNRKRKWGLLMEIVIRSAAGAAVQSQSRSNDVKLNPQFGNRPITPFNQPKPGISPKP